MHVPGVGIRVSSCVLWRNYAIEDALGVARPEDASDRLRVDEDAGQDGGLVTRPEIRMM